MNNEIDQKADPMLASIDETAAQVLNELPLVDKIGMGAATFSAEGAKFASWITRTHPRTVVDLSANSMLTSSGLHCRHSDHQLYLNEHGERVSDQSLLNDLKKYLENS